MHRPIVILNTGRCGSSMLGRILAAHGVWTGEVARSGDHRNPHGYYENRGFKVRVRSYKTYGPIPYDPTFAAWAREELARQGYAGGPWMVKHAANGWRLWLDMDPVYWLPRRDIETVFRSHRAAGFNHELSDDRLRRWLHTLVRQMDWVRDRHNGTDIDTPAVIAGALTTLRHAFEAASLTMNEDTVREIVDPTLLHEYPA